ncbi:MAG: type II toxin-antitoxin system HicB family antitoxin [Verrucomicrobia bacterium]|nr:type II toxin-antitoxin system HicB family antitoxin [Verrucomicrobiota bacterium]
MISQYIAAAMKQARFERMENGRYFATIPACKGCWVEGASIKECRKELPEALESWLLLGLQLRHTLPTVDGIDLNPQPAYAQAD